MFGNGRACAGPRGNTARRKICYCYLMYLSTTWMDGWVLESMRKKTLRQKKKQWVKSSSWPLPEVISNGCFVEALALVEELSNIIAGILQQVILNQELDPLRKRQGPGLHPRWTNHISERSQQLLPLTFLGSMLNFFRPMATCLFLCIFFLEHQSMGCC